MNPLLSTHPTVVEHRRKATSAGFGNPRSTRWSVASLRQLALDAGADDAAVVGLDHPDLADERLHVLAAFPRAKSLLAFVCRMSREPIRSPARSLANLEFHHTGERVNELGLELVAALEREGVGAVVPSMGFPMEMSRFPGRIWVVSHKLVAQAAGLGQIGIHRNLIHPRFGNFVLLGTVLLDVDLAGEEESQPLDFNPCLECKLCVAACPVGAIKADGAFDFSACYTHNYREFMGGFTDWVEAVADSNGRADYRKRVTPGESSSMWQSLSFGANYKAAYCLAVCPAGEDVIGPYLESPKEHVRDVVRPLQQVEETVYVVAGSDAEEHVRRRFPSKRPKQVGNGLAPVSITGFLAGLPLTFQRGAAKELSARYHFRFRGTERREATVEIRQGTLTVHEGLEGRADCTVRADASTWLGFLAKERSLLWALLGRRIRISGDPRLLSRFGRCFAA